LIDGIFTIGKSVRNGVKGLVTGKDQDVETPQQ
jgi:hypothetical protein